MARAAESAGGRRALFSPYRMLLMAGTPWGFFLSLCLCGLLFYPALLVASILFPAAG